MSIIVDIAHYNASKDFYKNVKYVEFRNLLYVPVKGEISIFQINSVSKINNYLFLEGNFTFKDFSQDLLPLIEGVNLDGFGTVDVNKFLRVMIEKKSSLIKAETQVRDKLLQILQENLGVIDERN